MEIKKDQSPKVVVLEVQLEKCIAVSVQPNNSSGVVSQSWEQDDVTQDIDWTN